MSTSPRAKQARIDRETWRQLFIEEMRRCGADGRRIGDAVATVDEYCAEAGTGPVAAFGDPAEYAHSLTGRGPDWRATVRSFLPVLALAAAIVMAALLPWRWGTQPTAVMWGSLLLPVWLCVFMAASSIGWPHMKRHTGWGMVVYVVLFMAWSTVNTALHDDRHHALTVPAWTLWALAGLLTVASAPLIRRAVRDRVVNPVTGASRDQAPAWAWSSLWLLAPLLPVVVVALRATLH